MARSSWRGFASCSSGPFPWLSSARRTLADDGIDVDAPRTTVTGNHAWFNRDFGIEALPDTLGGANWAKHNGNRAQCTPARLCSTRGKPKR